MKYKIESKEKAKRWQPLPLPGFEIVGVIITDGGMDKGALALCECSGQYVQLNTNVARSLDQRRVKAALGISNNAGAPKKMNNGRRRTLYMADLDWTELSVLGGGNASKGLRELIKSSDRKY